MRPSRDVWSIREPTYLARLDAINRAERNWSVTSIARQGSLQLGIARSLRREISEPDVAGRNGALFQCVHRSRHVCLRGERRVKDVGRAVREQNAAAIVPAEPRRRHLEREMRFARKELLAAA